LVIEDTDKAEKLKQSLPPGILIFATKENHSNLGIQVKELK
jgi:hypothetical protein